MNNHDQQGGLLVVRHLVSAGYKNIAMFSLQSESSSILSEREMGYRRGMVEAGLGAAINIVHSPQVMRDVQFAARRLLQGPKRPDAIFCWTDFIALEVISVATELGLRVPQDVGIVGYDNTMYCDFAQNSLTSIDQSGELLGLQATRLVIERINGRTGVEHFVVPPRLVARRSTSQTVK